ncbi:hypothetical protein VTI74DRAFT_4618 [Chaetomium olivicolor]
MFHPPRGCTSRSDVASTFTLGSGLRHGLSSWLEAEPAASDLRPPIDLTSTPGTPASGWRQNLGLSNTTKRKK